MHIIVFSWLSRTGKTRALTVLETYFKEKGKKVLLYKETANIYLEAHAWEEINRYDFQKEIVDNELVRLKELKYKKENNEADIVLVDRTFLDMFVYIYRGILHGHITNSDLLSDLHEWIELSKELYDEIFFFDTMLKEDLNFADYNCDEIKNLFINSFKAVYKDKLQLWPNFKVFREELDIWSKKYMV